MQVQSLIILQVVKPIMLEELLQNYYSNQPGCVKNCYWLSGSTSLGIGVNVTTNRYSNIISFNSGGASFQRVCNVNDDGTYTGTSLLAALNAWVNSVASTDLKTWTSSGSLPVFSAPWAPPTYSATVTVNKDGSAWSGSGKSLALYQNSTNKYSLTLSGSSATVSALAGTYDIYDGASDTGVDLVVSSGGGNAATVNYYTLDLAAGTGTSLPNGSGVYLLGKNVPINVTVNTGYQWSKWTSSNTAKLWDQTAKSISITMPDAPITLTATSVPIQYTIGYSLNGWYGSL